MIEVRDITKSFGRVRAVRGVSFDVGRGEVAGLLGANGAGKTTTLRMITGFLPPDAGVIRIVGMDMAQQSLQARRLIGYLSESAPAYSEMLARDYLTYRARLFGMDRRAARARVGRVMERCGLAPVARRRIGHLSKGFRQRVGLASAMLHDPDVLVLDEPTNGLDPAQIRAARTLIKELAEDRTVLISSHILPEIELVCDRVIIMAAGRVRADGRVSELLATSDDLDRYYVEIRPRADDRGRAGEAAVELVRAIRGVRSARANGSHGEWAKVTIDAEQGAGDLREPIAEAAGRAGALVRELHADKPSLERLFLRIMETEETPGGGENREEER